MKFLLTWLLSGIFSIFSLFCRWLICILVTLVWTFSVGEDFDEVEDDADIDEIDQQEVSNFVATK